MFHDVFEVHWRVGGRAFSLVIAPDGTPQLGGEVSAGAPASPPPVPPPVLPPVPTGPANRGRAWTEEDEARIRAGHEAGEGTEVLAAAVGRSRGAVLARLVKLGLVDPAEADLRYPVTPAGA